MWNRKNAIGRANTILKNNSNLKSVYKDMYLEHWNHLKWDLHWLNKL